ncbi:MlaA family lipoprotein [Chromatium okenii]|uniref:ABC transporter n=1 Tax=Chromatium okenii TaxID=61644 RepID=A0A2S7XVG1_9GAMM|nr:VacJ family lipoprotein [Chromatium okenii]PQJ97680.1 ABC transporter [Chromatium okenii]
MDVFRLSGLGVLSAALLIGGCASTAVQTKDPRDPLEPFNRAVFRFNSDFDRAFIKPLAKGYRAITPEPVDRSISNFFYNLADVTSAVNNLLQFKMSRTGSDVGRVLINSTVGVLGFFDVATNVGLPSYKEDFGQTLGYWGIESGAYVMLPLLGPSSMRDTFGWAGDIMTDPLTRIDDTTAHVSLLALQTTDRRADYLAAGDIMDDAAIDTYSFLRDAYLQRRLSLVHDGNPPLTENKDDVWKDIDFEDKKPDKPTPAATQH